METSTEKAKPGIEEVVDELKLYVGTSMELYKMKATEKGAEIFSQAIIHVMIGVFAALVFLFASLALAFSLSAYFDKLYSGFLIVAGLYSIIVIVLFASRDKWLKGKLVNNIIKAVYAN